MYSPGKKRLGELLLEVGLITSEQLAEALENQRETHVRLGKVLINLGFVTERDVIRVLKSQLGFKYMDLEKIVISRETARLIPEAMAQRYKVIPVMKTETGIILAMVDPLNVYAIDDVRLATGLHVEPVIATETAIDNAIARHFAMKESLDKLISDLHESMDAEADDPEGLERLLALVEEAPIVKLVNSFINQAIIDRASDIHVEPGEKDVRIRYRIDGVLFDMMHSPKSMQAPTISRLKIMASLDIAERRVPQDGRIKLKFENREVDLRVSTLPTIFGEKVVLRILDKSRGLLALEELGLLDENYREFKAAIKQPHGIIMVTGPTGSGKTTTLYAALNHLNSINKNIITLEDPVEYTLAGVNQVQLNNRAGLTFAGGLRSILRQDPDIIMVGEIRDGETARIAIQSAMTGHLVLSTLHTNSASSTLARLLDMGMEPFLIASSVVAIRAKRLVRGLCQHCKQPVELSTGVLVRMGLTGEMWERASAYRAVGCPFCNQTGYKGRLALHEVLIVDKEIRELVTNKASTDKIEEAARAAGMRTLQEDGLRKVLKGVTSLEEVMRTVYIQEGFEDA